MATANTRAGKTAKAEARDLPSATPAGEGIPGTNTASEKADAEGAAGAAPVAEAEARGARQEPAPPAAGTISPVAEAAAADQEAMAEALTPAGGSMEDLLGEPVMWNLHVRALPEGGFRRAGRFWPSGEGITVAATAFTDEQIEALEGEPMLSVTWLPVAATE